MIVVAIVGILVAVCVPLYMSYTQKSRVKALVYPGLHIIQTNISLKYAMSGTMPDAGILPEIIREADTMYFHLGLSGHELVVTIDSPASTSKLSRLHGLAMYMRPDVDNLKVKNWTLRGPLADRLGITTE